MKGIKVWLHSENMTCFFIWYISLILEKKAFTMNNKKFTVKKTNLYEQIADCLENEIIHSEKEIVKLPSEKDLSIQFNVSKTAIREALKVLKERGLIKSKNGEHDRKYSRKY